VNFARALIAVSICLARLLPWASTQSVPRDLKTWTLEYFDRWRHRPVPSCREAYAIGKSQRLKL